MSNLLEEVSRQLSNGPAPHRLTKAHQSDMTTTNAQDFGENIVMITRMEGRFSPTYKAQRPALFIDLLFFERILFKHPTFSSCLQQSQVSIR